MVSHLILAFVKSVGMTSTNVIYRNIIPHGFTKEQVDFGIRCLCLLGLIHSEFTITLEGQQQDIFY